MYVCKYTLCKMELSNTKVALLVILFLISYSCSVYFLEPQKDFLATHISVPQIKSNRQIQTNHQSTILLWSKLWAIGPQNIECGPYKCYLTRNRSVLQKSDMIVFNARFTKGKYFMNLKISAAKNK